MLMFIYIHLHKQEANCLFWNANNKPDITQNPLLGENVERSMNSFSKEYIFDKKT